ncbi:bifunctional diaminohydroxyphosphoribosylaminopyrimidine deaminase/5-amino-6-(5-phosphoribosylamino)uracil reductase RibD [Gordonia sp. HY285]|uniref:bifunctional diaminohydroxyphosphoribosylaminopyrimidine deaminase/5-amino-6-(5-phosphoribosylamino)uracil reductase RibD n=1 Tax=Gordonia liuliyuniae TaxID=2911517 RepID=UPI001F01001B|nr:bifunctional diaminohydroxyphosphoribosylaminopyrimidine deaminase/5-amino-6-(5-phosphoribosylamino)uracil reductase RibD [Gordonia liuliyuniae]MCF8610686.1 bifunctional diaminohydroxyphosphoribosylaminopyrimidine deaminase/5-amino-6-(5-phosphoribosylamino)uracil reductase RibD [Gordonia liuliyuniae]
MIETAMRRAVGVSADARGASSPNPPVGAVILDADGLVVGVGRTQPPGGPHAEVMALREAGDAALGGTAVVTLEPCNHTGRTGPCAHALIDAGVAAVHYGVADPNPSAAGGAQTLRAAGVEVSGGVLETEVRRGPLRGWLRRQESGRPYVTVKIAATVDGRIAAADGTSQWITGAAAREHAHAQRAAVDAIIVGTGTALADDPSLTARRPDGSMYPHQPTRVVMGWRAVGATARLRDGTSPFVQVRSHDPHEVLAMLPDALAVIVEGGPAIVGAFLAADLADEVHAYLAPTILGHGAAAVTDTSVTTLTQAHRFRRESVTELADDLLVTLIRDQN